MTEKKYDHLTKTAISGGEAFARLRELIEVLRAECPWDRVQDHRSLRPCMLEEAYEVAEAIDRNDSANLREELGDVLLQVVFHSSLAEEAGDFDLTDVINEECEKMIRRHPHIFLDDEAKTVDKVLEKWENIKVKEHGEASCTSRLREVPSALPALIRSYKVQNRAEDSGFDEDEHSDAFTNLTKDVNELIEACKHSDDVSAADKLGDLLFSTVSAARKLGVEPEEALERSVERFIDRFERAEKAAEIKQEKSSGQ